MPTFGEWGSCHVLLTDTLVAKFLTENRGDLLVEKAVIYDDEGRQRLYSVTVHSPQLPKGYHGVQEMWLSGDGTVQFKREHDT